MSFDHNKLIAALCHVYSLRAFNCCGLWVTSNYGGLHWYSGHLRQPGHRVPRDYVLLSGSAKIGLSFRLPLERPGQTGQNTLLRFLLQPHTQPSLPHTTSHHQDGAGFPRCMLSQITRLCHVVGKVRKVIFLN